MACAEWAGAMGSAEICDEARRLPVVVRRTAEIGIRMALGAARAKVTAMVMRGAMVQAMVGLAGGVPTAMFCVKYVRSQLY